jgi:hypothetical protein
MSSFVAFGSRRISLVEHSRSNFALIVSFLCAGEDLPPLDDVDKGCQCKIQTNESWVPTRTRRRRSSNEGHSLLE